MDTYVFECSGCWKRQPARYLTRCDNKNYCHICWKVISRISGSIGKEVAPASHAGNHANGHQMKRDWQKLRNESKPDVMDAKVPPRKSLFPR